MSNSRRRAFDDFSPEKSDSAAIDYTGESPELVELRHRHFGNRRVRSLKWERLSIDEIKALLPAVFGPFGSLNGRDKTSYNGVDHDLVNAVVGAVKCAPGAIDAIVQALTPTEPATVPELAGYAALWVEPAYGGPAVTLVTPTSGTKITVGHRSSGWLTVDFGREGSTERAFQIVEAIGEAKPTVRFVGE